MRIALTTDSFVEGQGGVSTAVATLARALRQRGHQVVVYSAADPCHAHSDLDVIGLWALRLERFPGGRAPVDPARLVRELLHFRPDVIHNHSMSVMGVQALAAARVLGIPILATCHVYLAGFLNYAPLSLEGRPMAEKAAWRYTVAFFNRFPYVTTPSKVMQQKLLSAGLRAPSAIVSNGVDTSLFHPRPSFTHPLSPTVLHVGRLGYEKRVDVVLRAFARLAPAFPRARLIVAGDGPQAGFLRAQAMRLGVAHRVLFVGHVPRSRLPVLYRQADLFVTASPIETQGLVVLEAMASGLPAVGVNALALPELIRPGENGILVPAGDDLALSQAMACLLQSQALRQEAGTASRQLALQHNLPSVAERYEAIYLELCRQAQPSWLSYLPPTQRPALAWKAVRAQALALQGAGHERALSSTRSVDRSVRKAFGPIVKWLQNRLLVHWG